MYRMTIPAVSSLVLPIDMKVVQVSVAVAKPGSIRSVGEAKQVPVMATETKLELVFIVRNVRILGELLCQQFCVR